MNVETRNFLIGILISVLIHAGILYYSSKYTKKKQREIAELREVSLLEEHMNKKVNPKVLKLIARQKAMENKKMTNTGNVLNINKSEKKLRIAGSEPEKIKIEKSNLEQPSVPGPSISIEGGKSQMPELSSASINLNNVPENADVEGADVVLSFSGKGKSTEQILKEKPVSGINLSSQGLSGNDGGEKLIGREGVPAGRIKLTEKSGSELKALEQESNENVIKRPQPPQISLKKTRRKKRTKPAISLSGPLKNRKILHRITPLYPEMALREGAEGTVILKFYVTEDGRVRQDIFIVKSSGYPELDKAAMDALKSWVFEPIKSSEENWGILTVIFELI